MTLFSRVHPFFVRRTCYSRRILGGRGANISVPFSSSICHVPVSAPPTDQVHPPFARYTFANRIVILPNSELIVLSGQLGIQPNGTIPNDIESQTKVAFENIKHILKEAHNNAGLQHIYKINAYVTDRKYLKGYMKARDEIMIGHLHPPTFCSTLMIVSGFANESFLVEIEAFAAINIPKQQQQQPIVEEKQPQQQQSSLSSTTTTRTTVLQSSGVHNKGTDGNQQRRSMHSFASSHRGFCRHHVQHPTMRNRGLTTTSSPSVSSIAIDEFAKELRSSSSSDSNLKVLLPSDDDDSRREIIRRSKDFYWYSPILKPLLRKCQAQVLVMPQNEQDVVDICRLAVKHKIPLTTRGAGTGNYGQAMPLYGGAILDMSLMNTVEMMKGGVMTAGAGAKLCDMEDEARKFGWELRQHPSTRLQATIGGFIAGGSTGHGALLHGGLAEDGAVLGLRVVTAEVEPRILELRGKDVFPVVHAYGTNGIVTAVELPLARAQPWTDLTLTFSTLQDAAAFALDVANASAVVKRAVSVYQAPIPHAFLDADTLLHDSNVTYTDPKLAADPNARHVCTVQCASTSMGPIERLALARSGQLTRVLPSEDAPRPFYEFGWNHTTLHAKRNDKSTTYLQAALSPENALELVDRVSREFGEHELLQHLEVMNFQGRMGFASLALLWPQGSDLETQNERLREIMKWHESVGIPIFDPHTHVLEDGGMKQTNWAQLGFKRKVDPFGILNPGKMRAWEEQSATTDVDDESGAFTAAYRLAETAAIGDGSSTHDRDAETVPAETESTTKPRSRYWAEWSTADFATVDLSEAVAILPIGAVEAHGPHLPLGVDAMHNADLLERALKQLPRDVTVLSLPPMDVGVSCEHSGFAGTLELSAETAATAWTEVAACVARTGVRKLILYNSHGGNQALAEVVSRRVRKDHGMLCVLAMNLGQAHGDEVAKLFPEDEVRYGIHGGALETSLMMHLRPHLVSTEAAQDFASAASKLPKDNAFQIHAAGWSNKVGWLSQDLNPAGVVGAAATESDATKGALLAEACVKNLVKLFVDVHGTNVDALLSNQPLYPPQGSGPKEM